MNVSFTEIRNYLKVIECGSFTSAAKQLQTSTTMVSRHIGSLEQKLGRCLLARNTRGFSVTEDGQAFYQRCLKIQQHMQHIEELLQFEPVTSGVLRVTAPIEFTDLYLSHWLPCYLKLNPAMAVNVEASNKLEDIIQSGFDCALRFCQKYDANIPGRQLAKTALLLVASADFVAQSGTFNVEAISDYPALVFADPTPWNEFQWTQKNSDVTGSIQLKNKLSCTSPGMLKRVLLQGQHIAIMPSMLIAEELAKGELVNLMPSYCFGYMNLYAVFPDARRMPAKTRNFIDFLVERFNCYPEDDPFLNPEFLHSLHHHD